MSVMKTIVLTFVKRNLVETPCVIKHGSTYLHFGHVRYASTLPITKHLSLISNEKKKVKDLKLSEEQNKPLVIMPTWLMAKERYIMKYAQIYLDYDFDVLNISATPWQLLWPIKGTQLLANDILKFLYINKTYSPLIIHGFSVGAYVWSEVLVQLAAKKTHYQQIINRIQGQIFDSAADITELVIGVPIAVFPNNKVMQNALRSYLLYHLKTFDKVATSHYVRASQMYHTNFIKAPALMFFSKKDPIGAESSNVRARENWESNGIKVYSRCFEDSPHVGHMQKYPKEYLAEVTNYLDKLKLQNQREKIQIKQ